MFITRLFLRLAALRRVSAAVLFGDLQKAYYSVLVELATGPLAWFTVEGSPYYFVHNIGVKPGDPSADVLFAFVFSVSTHA